MHDILESHVEYCWIDMPLGPREKRLPAPVARVATLESLVAQRAAAGADSGQSYAIGLGSEGQADDDDDFILELSDDDDCD
ncbi:MAG TPA: hypothetical protein VGX78_10250 [Pirellulales bacterium]|jgi:hypothetical protein|nr:hypothetical protein [Pirellulales bacterium]